MEEIIFENKYDVTIENVTEKFNCLGLAGPMSRAILSKLTDADLSSVSYPFLHTREIDVAGIPVRAIRISYTGKIFSLSLFIFLSQLTVHCQYTQNILQYYLNF